MTSAAGLAERLARWLARLLHRLAGMIEAFGSQRTVVAARLSDQFPGAPPHWLAEIAAHGDGPLQQLSGTAEGISESQGTSRPEGVHRAAPARIRPPEVVPQSASTRRSPVMFAPATEAGGGTKSATSSKARARRSVRLLLLSSQTLSRSGLRPPPHGEPVPSARVHAWPADWRPARAEDGPPVAGTVEDRRHSHFGSTRRMPSSVEPNGKEAAPHTDRAEVNFLPFSSKRPLAGTKVSTPSGVEELPAGWSTEPSWPALPPFGLMESASLPSVAEERFRREQMVGLWNG